MIRRIAGYNQVATTPTDQMGTPPDIGKSKMGSPPEPVQAQADGSVVPQLQQSALQKAGEQRLQASLLQTELLAKISGESGPGDEKSIKSAKGLTGSDGGVENPTTMPDLQNILNKN